MFKKIVLSLGVLVSAFVFSLLLIRQVPNTDAEVLSTQTESGSCGAYIVSPVNGETISGEYDIKAYVNPVHMNTDTGTLTAVDLSYVRFRTSAGVEIGTVNKPTSGWSNQVRLDNWNTQTITNGSVSIYAVLNYSDQIVCNTSVVTVSVQNGSSGSTTNENNYVLKLTVSPTSWKSPTYYSSQLYAQAKLHNKDTLALVADVTGQTYFSWATNVGQLLNFYGSSATFKSGPVADDGTISVSAEYGGLSASRQINVEVYSSSSSSTTTGSSNTSTSIDDSTTSTTNNSGASATGTDDQNVGYFLDGSEQTYAEEEADDSDKLNDPAEQRKQILSCIYKKLGQTEFDNLLVSKSRFTTAQFALVHGCFAVSRFVIPASVAPVDPTKISTLPESKVLTFNKPRNIERIVNNEKVNIIELNGTAEPDKTIFLYIFSEPLVLSTKTDSTGRWVYTLEEPLEPGEHEVYVLVEGDETSNQFVRSSVFSFAIASTGVTTNNPNGYSLTLTGENYQLTTYYVIGAVILVLIAALLLTKFLWTKPLAKDADSETVVVDKASQDQDQNFGSDVKPV